MKCKEYRLKKNMRMNLWVAVYILFVSHFVYLLIINSLQQSDEICTRNANTIVLQQGAELPCTSLAAVSAGYLF